MPMAISYEIICALERMPPRNGIFRIRRVSRQNDSINAQRNDAERVKNSDIQIRNHHFLMTQFEPNGMIATVSRLGIITIAGASQ